MCEVLIHFPTIYGDLEKKCTMCSNTIILCPVNRKSSWWPMFQYWKPFSRFTLNDLNQEEKFMITLHSQFKSGTRYLMKNI